MKGSNKVNGEGATTVDPAFKVISKSSSAFFIWRVENLQLVPVPKDQYGIFYDGDSYIVYAASESGKHVGPETKHKDIHGKMEMHIHFWLGRTTSQDESAVAAFKSVELDDYLGGSPVQHREVRGYESARFKAYFKQGIRIMLGGVESALKSANNNVEVRLFRVKGRRCPILTQMPAVSWEYFNSGDVFIIDHKDVVFVWSGRFANSMEKLQAAKIATQFQTERKALSIVFVDDGKEMELTHPEQTLLGYYLDLSPLAKRLIAESGEDDSLVECSVRSALKLYRCSDSDGIYKVVEVKTGALEQSDLDPNDSFIIDNGPWHIWVWVGRHASVKERVEAMRNAHGFLKKKSYPSHARVTRVVDGGEPIDFKLLFTSWRDDDKYKAVKIQNSNGHQKLIPLNMDSNVLHANLQLAAQEQMVDDGSGSLIVWKVNATSLEEIPAKINNILYSAESYVIRYVYKYENKECSLLYYWKGQDKVESEKNSLGRLTISHETTLAHSHVQIRTVQGKEPPHFLAAFRGRLIVMDGESESTLPQVFLLQIKGNQTFNTHATQFPLQKSSLNSNFVYVLRTDDQAFVWCGKGSTGDEREMAKNVAKAVSDGELVVIYEGLEKSDFWKYMTNEGVYANVRSLKMAGTFSSTRLFHLFSKKGSLKVEEIMNFTQNDLISEDILLLDAFHTLFIWIGSKSVKDDRSKVPDFTSEYLETDPCKRSTDLTVVQIEQGYEPPIFTGFFPSWDSNHWKEEKTFDDIRKELDEQKPTLQVDLIVNENIPNFLECDKYPLSVLAEKNPDKLPDGVDVKHKEIYLSPKEFIDVFGMSYEDFTAHPKWKQEHMKKKVGLF